MQWRINGGKILLSAARGALAQRRHRSSSWQLALAAAGALWHQLASRKLFSGIYRQRLQQAHQLAQPAAGSQHLQPSASAAAYLAAARQRHLAAAATHLRS